MSYLIDVVLLVALVLTSLRVGTMHRELRRLRGYQMQYVQVFGETSRAADNIGVAVRQIGGEGREVLQRLETAIDRAGALAKHLDGLARVAEPRTLAAQSDDIGPYSRRPATSVATVEADSPELRNEILKFAGDSRRLLDRRTEVPPEPRFSPLQPDREIRLAPSVKTLRAAGGIG
jgi:hypothetical protein